MRGGAQERGGIRPDFIRTEFNRARVQFRHALEPDAPGQVAPVRVQVAGVQAQFRDTFWGVVDGPMPSDGQRVNLAGQGGGLRVLVVKFWVRPGELPLRRAAGHLDRRARGQQAAVELGGIVGVGCADALEHEFLGQAVLRQKRRVRPVGPGLVQEELRSGREPAHEFEQQAQVRLEGFGPPAQAADLLHGNVIPRGGFQGFLERAPGRFAVRRGAQAVGLVSGVAARVFRQVPVLFKRATPEIGPHHLKTDFAGTVRNGLKICERILGKTVANGQKTDDLHENHLNFCS